MKKYMIAIAIAFSALFGLSVQAAPLTENTAAVQSQVAQDSATTKVYWRRGYGWRGGYGFHRGMVGAVDGAAMVCVIMASMAVGAMAAACVAIRGVAGAFAGNIA